LGETPAYRYGESGSPGAGTSGSGSVVVVVWVVVEVVVLVVVVVVDEVTVVVFDVVVVFVVSVVVAAAEEVVTVAAAVISCRVSPPGYLFFLPEPYAQSTASIAVKKRISARVGFLKKLIILSFIISHPIAYYFYSIII